MVLEVAASIYDPVTTTDELIPSGDTSSYRSNPERLAGFALLAQGAPRMCLGAKGSASG